MPDAPTLSPADIEALGYELRDGVAVRVRPANGVTSLASLAAAARAAPRPHPSAGRSHGGRGGGGRVSKTQARYAALLDQLVAAGQLAWVLHDRVSFALDAHPSGRRVHYRPDAVVGRLDGTVELHEVKGHMEEDARVKLRWCASVLPQFALRVVRFERGHFREVLTFNSAERFLGE